MRRMIVVFTLFIIIPLAFLSAFTREGQAGPESGGITSPVEGQAVQGSVPIVGTTDVEQLQKWELTFSYINNPNDTWFFIAEGNEAVQNDTIGHWDTTTITDGRYKIRLTITQKSGERTDFTVTNLRVRNYTPIETNTPHPSPTIQLSETPTPKLITPTPLPTNPVEITSDDFSRSLTRGALGAFALLLLLGLYTTLRKTIF